MLRAALFLFVLSLVAALLGFGGLANGAAWLAQIFALVFLVASVISFVLGRRPAM